MRQWTLRFKRSTNYHRTIIFLVLGQIHNILILAFTLEHIWTSLTSKITLKNIKFLSMSQMRNRVCPERDVSGVKTLKKQT